MFVYFHWWVHWDLDKVMAALARHYDLKDGYVADNPASVEAIVTRAYQEYHGVHDLNVDTHMRFIKQQVAEMLQDEDPIAPTCVRCQAYHHMLDGTRGFDLKDLVGKPPYPDHWERPRPKFDGAIEGARYAS